MKLGIPKEVKDHEYRVGATPSMVSQLVVDGHEVLIETGAGHAIGFTDKMYRAAGATIVDTPAEVYTAELIVKVKEPQPSEYPLIQEGQILFCYLHLAPDPKQTEALLDRKAIAIAYETITDDYGRLPLLTPMSEIAGRISIQAGATALQMANGGRGVLLGGVPGVHSGKVVVIGGGVVGTNAAEMAMGLGADVTILDTNVDRLRALSATYGPRLKTLYSSKANLAAEVTSADLVVGAVLLPGGTAPKLVTREMVKKMKMGSVIVDVAIDQGGCFETSKPTTHSNPTYIVDGIVHYCVTNMPGGCAYTATEALTNVTFPYLRKLASMGVEQAVMDDPHLRAGVNTCLGEVTYLPVARDLHYECHSVLEVLAALPA
jgi:alanine dehydrogenase